VAELSGVAKSPSRVLTSTKANEKRMVARLPDYIAVPKVVLRLIDSEHAPLRVANVLFFVHTFANRKVSRQS